MFSKKYTRTLQIGLLFIIPILLISCIGPSTAEARTKIMHAPLLAPKYPDLLVWKWHYKNPYRWNVWISLDNGKSFFFIDDYWGYGSARQFAPDGGSELMYIVGVDQQGKEVTLHSNIVRPDDAPISPIKKPPHPKK